MTLPPKKAEDIPRASVAVGGIYDFTAASYKEAWSLSSGNQRSSLWDWQWSLISTWRGVAESHTPDSCLWKHPHRTWRPAISKLRFLRLVAAIIHESSSREQPGPELCCTTPQKQSTLKPGWVVPWHRAVHRPGGWTRNPKERWNGFSPMTTQNNYDFIKVADV